MPQYASDSEVIKALFGGRLAKERAEQESRQRAELESRIGALQSELNNSTGDPKVYADLADCQARFGDHAGALGTLKAGVERHPTTGDLHYALLRRLQKYGLDQEALAAGERACELVPDDFSLRLEYNLYLPKLYDSEPEIHAWRRRFEEGLEKCIAACDLGTHDGAMRAARGFSRYTNFYLAYQGFDDLALIRQYGEFVHRVMSAAYPQWSKLAESRGLARPQPLVGYVSAYFRDHTAGKLFLGWLTERDRSLYRAHCYYVGDLSDSVTEDYQRASDYFFQSRNLETICEAIQRDQPDVLVFTDVGMHPVASQIAALRLAPVQCVTWGHPVTTGLPTIDYFISSELMEPLYAQEHYTEKLVRLPNLGICYAKPSIPRAFLTKTRADFGLPDDAVTYLSCQSLFKYLPQHDHLFAEIAVAVRNAQFVFLAPNELRGTQFLKRLERAFSAVGLKPVDFCTVLSEQNPFDYWNLNLLSDVFLDSVEWSGGRTSLEAVACGLPIVTLPGRLMRSRHSTAILTLAGLSETIPKGEIAYVEAATNLGKDPSWRREVASRIESANYLLFSDYSSVRALESFLTGACST